jgi:predicted extracellular nuclease
MSKRTFLLLVVILLTSSLSPSLVDAQSGCGNDDGALFFSEYVEGSSYNKALEIFNGYATAADLSNFQIKIYFNGNATPGVTLTLSGTLNPGDVFVLADARADPAILSVADQTTRANLFNGDDAIALVQVASQQDGSALNVTHDVIGQIGFDPGSEWGSGNASTRDNTIRRKTSVSQGDADGSDAFDPSAEWDGYPVDTFGGLGAHTATCTPTAITFARMTARTGPSGAHVIALLLGCCGVVFLRFWLHRPSA